MIESHQRCMYSGRGLTSIASWVLCIDSRELVPLRELDASALVW